jgi:hypothetical protein
MGDKELPYGLIAIITSVFFLIASLDMLEFTVFSKGLSGILAYALVALGAYTIAKTTK